MNISLETLPGCNHINSPNCQHAICVSLQLLLHPEDCAVLGLGGKRLPPLHRLFSSHLGSRRKLLFPKLGDSFATLLWGKGRKGVLLCSSPLVQERDPQREWKKEWEGQPSSSLNKTFSFLLLKNVTKFIIITLKHSGVELLHC